MRLKKKKNLKSTAIEFLQNKEFIKIGLTFFIAVILFKFMLSMFASESLSVNQLAGLGNQEIPVFSMNEPLVGSNGLQEMRSEGLKILGEKMDSYKITSAIFSNLREDCLWNPQKGLSGNEAGVPLEALGLANPLILLSPIFGTSSIDPLLPGKPAYLKSIPRISKFVSKEDNHELEITFVLSGSSMWTGARSNSKLTFSSQAFNAFDLGYNTIRINSEKSLNIAAGLPKKAFINVAEFGCVPSEQEGMPGTNKLILFSIIPIVTIETLPATVVFELWKDRLSNLDQPENPSDINFVMKFI